MKPNESKYFDEEHGCTYNTKCVVCGKPQYCPEGIHTYYHGKRYLHNRKELVVGVNTAHGIMCEQCFIEGENEKLSKSI